jgi:hypothetical protein
VRVAVILPTVPPPRAPGTTCCALAQRQRLSPEALAGLDVALRAGTPYRQASAAAGLEPGAASAVYRHLTRCLKQGVKQEAEAATKHGEAQPEATIGHSLPHPAPSTALTRSPFAVGNPGDDAATSPRKVVTALFEDRALELRCQSKSYAYIAAELGVSECAAMDAVERVLVRTRRGTNAKADLARRLDVERVDRLIAGIWDRATAAPEAFDFDGEPATPDYEAQDRAIAQVTKLLERRAKLLGLDAPTGVRLSIVDAARGDDDFGEVWGVVFKILDARYPGASATVAAGLDVYRDKGSVDGWLAGDLAVEVAVGGS